MTRGLAQGKVVGAAGGEAPVATTPTVAYILAVLDAAYGPKENAPDGDPLGGLVGTILSQTTSDINSERAYTALRVTFSRWEGVLAAPEEEVAEAIRNGGLAAGVGMGGRCRTAVAPRKTR